MLVKACAFRGWCLIISCPYQECRGLQKAWNKSSTGNRWVQENKVILRRKPGWRLFFHYPGERHHFAILYWRSQPPNLVANGTSVCSMVMVRRSSNPKEEVKRDGKQMEGEAGPRPAGEETDVVRDYVKQNNVAEIPVPFFFFSSSTYK